MEKSLVTLDKGTTCSSWNYSGQRLATGSLHGTLTIFDSRDPSSSSFSCTSKSKVPNSFLPRLTFRFHLKASFFLFFSKFCICFRFRCMTLLALWKLFGSLQHMVTQWRVFALMELCHCGKKLLKVFNPVCPNLSTSKFNVLGSM